MELVTRDPILVHPILTDEQALLIHQCLIARNSDPEVFSEDEGEEARIRKELGDLTTFFYAIIEHPENFKLRSRDDVQRVIRAARPIKGPAQAKTNKRKRAQRRSQGGQKRDRALRKQQAAEWNEAVAKMKAEQEEAEAAYAEAMEKAVARFEAIARKESISSEELQEVLEGFGSPEAAIRVRELRAAEDPQRRLDAAAGAADQGAASESA